MHQKDFGLEKLSLALPGRRYLGQFIDGLISIALFVIMIALSKSFNLNDDLFNLLSLMIPFSYFVFSDSLPGGQSLGKKPFGIMVVSKRTGKPCTILQSFIRNFFTPILGSIDAIFILGKKRERLGDKWAGTIVINKS